MEKKDFKANGPRNGDRCYVNNNVTEEQHLIGRREQKYIEDKGEIETAAAVADIEKPAKKGWGGWWACALIAAAVIGICLYFANRDADVDSPRTAQVYNSGNKQLASNDGTGTKKVVLVKKVIVPAKAAKATGVSAASATAGSMSAGAGNASASVSASGNSASGNAVSGNAAGLMTGNEPFATEASIDKASAQASSVDYIYYFGNDKSAVADNKLLDEIAEKASETGADITIVAYASETGSPAYNEKLTEMRASNLANYLEAHGVSADHIKIKAGGQTDQYGGSYSLNRRADILVDYAG